MNARKVDGLKGLDSMLCILGILRQLPNQRCHGMIKKDGDEFSRATTGRNNGSILFVRFVHFKKELNDACARCDGN